MASKLGTSAEVVASNLVLFLIGELIACLNAKSEIKNENTKTQRSHGLHSA